MSNPTEQIKTKLKQQSYIASDEIATVVYLAEELSKAWAAATGRELIRLQCYEGLDETKALYEWEYAKQMLYTQLLRSKLEDVVSGATGLREAADRIGAEEDVFFSERFLLRRPLLRALTSEKSVVLLIDEIDRADVEFEAFLLEVLSDYQVSIPELGTIVATHKPTVILTSNNTREALKRRCLYLFVDYPTSEEELAIVRLKVPDLSPKLAAEMVELIQQLRSLDLKKSPSISETLDWARALLKLNPGNKLDDDTVQKTLSVVLKHESDINRAKRALARRGANGGGPLRGYDDLDSFRYVGRN